MSSLMHVMDRLFGAPLLLLPEKAQTIAGVILSRTTSEAPIVIEGAALDGPSGKGGVEANRFVGSRRREDGSYSLTRSSAGVAVIDVVGSLVNRGAWVGANSGLVSYEGIGAQIDAAVAGAAKGEVKALIVDINSPGGEATGMFGVAEKLRAARAYMPVIAVVNDVAASAAYGIASAADEIVVSPTSIVGSIGVVMLHVDRTGANEKAGVVETAIFAGANKTLGMGRLTTEARASYQSLVDGFYARFLETVELGRGARTTADMAKATEASVFIGRDAIARGLADRVASFDQVLAELSTRPATRAQQQGMHMSNPTTPAATADQPAAGITEAEVSARADAARTEGRAEGVKAERERIGAIVSSDAAKGREALAHHFAFKTSMAAADAVAALEAAAKTETPKTGSRLDALVPDPKIGANGPDPKTTEVTTSGLDAALDTLIGKV